VGAMPRFAFRIGSVSVEIIGDSFRDRFEKLLGARRKTVWLASPFLTNPAAKWLAGLPASAHGDRRLLVSWDSNSIDTGYLSAHGVDVLRQRGFAVRDLRRLHAKMVIAGSRAYLGSGNLTSYGIDATNAEIGVFVNGSHATTAGALFDGWWKEAVPVSNAEIASAMKRQKRLLKKRGRSVDYEAQPGHQPPQSKRRVPQAWIKSQYYRHDGWAIAPGKEHWIGDPGEHDDDGNRIYRKDGVPAGEPRYKVGDTIGVYFGTTLKVPLIVEVIGPSRFDPKFAQEHNDGGEPDAGERWPWVTPVRGLHEVSLEKASDIDYLGIRGAIMWGRPHFRISPERYQKLLAKFSS
jgi:hypothetical protein